MNFALLIAGLMLSGCGGNAFEEGLDAPDVSVEGDAAITHAEDAATPRSSDEDSAPSTVRDAAAEVVALEPDSGSPSCSPFPSARGQPPCLPCGGCALQLVPMFYWVIVSDGCGAGYTPKACADCREHYTCGCLVEAGEIDRDAECDLSDGGILVVRQ